MPHLSIKNVPEAVVEKLRRRAAANHRSLQGELMAMVCRAAEDSVAVTRPTPPARPRGDDALSIEEIAASHRARWPKPFDASPDATEIVRTERDAR